MKDKRMKEKVLNNNNKSYDDVIKKKVYTPDNGNISTGVTTDDAYVKINYQQEMERIAKLEHERTKKVLKEIEETDLDSEDVRDVELRKTKNEEYF